MPRPSSAAKHRTYEEVCFVHVCVGPIWRRSTDSNSKNMHIRIFVSGPCNRSSTTWVNPLRRRRGRLHRRETAWRKRHRRPLRMRGSVQGLLQQLQVRTAKIPQDLRAATSNSRFVRGRGPQQKHSTRTDDTPSPACPPVLRVFHNAPCGKGPCERALSKGPLRNKGLASGQPATRQHSKVSARPGQGKLKEL